jgi:hypothetical protein
VVLWAAIVGLSANELCRGVCRSKEEVVSPYLKGSRTGGGVAVVVWSAASVTNVVTA